MSFNPATIPAAQYLGAPYALPGGGNAKLKFIALTFIWAAYGVSQANPNIAVNVNLAVTNQTSQLGSINGVFIDNTGSDGSVYVYAMDTQQIVPCGPYSTVFAPFHTQLPYLLVIGKGFATDDPSQTTVLVSNGTTPPAFLPELNITYPQFAASPSINRGINIYSPGYASPAIGDQYQFIEQAQATSLNTRLFGTPYSNGGIITLTDWEIQLADASVNAGMDGEIVLTSTGVSGLLYKIPFFVNQTGSAVFPSCLSRRSGLQYKLNAAETWQFQYTAGGNTAATGEIEAIFGYSYKGLGGAAGAPVNTTFGLFGSVATASRTLVSFGNYQIAGFQFVAPSSEQILSVSLQPQGAGFGGGGLNVSIYADNAGNPGALMGTSSDNAGPVFSFNTPIGIVNGLVYWIVAAVRSGNVILGTLTQAGTGFNSGQANTVVGIGVGTNMNANENWCWSVNCQSY
jgi:hypothetical protein